MRWQIWGGAQQAGCLEPQNELNKVTWYRQLKDSAVFQLIRNSLLYGFGDLLQKFFSILLVPVYSQYLNPSDYGILAMLGILTLILATITTCGLTNGISRYFHYAESENVTRAEIVWSPLLFVGGVTAVVIGVLCVFSGELSSLLFGKASLSYLVALTLLNVWISNVASILRAVLVVEEKVWPVNMINIFGVLAGLASGLYLVVIAGRGIYGVVESGLIASLVMALLAWWRSMPAYAFAFNIALLKKQLRFSLPLVMAVFAFFFIDSSDRVLLNLYLPLSEVGLYNIGYQIGMLMMLLVSGFTTAWPAYYHKHNQNGEGQLISKRVLQAILPGVAVFAVMISLSAPLALQWLTPNAFHGAFTVVSWVALAYMLKVPYLIFLMGVLMKEKTSWQLYLEGTAAAINVGLNFLLIPKLGREAAAITTFIAYSIMVIGAWRMTQWINPIPELAFYKGAGIVLIALLLSCLALVPGYMEASHWAAPLGLVICMIGLVGWIKRNFALLNIEKDAR